jgi:hypothetical protein
MANVFDLQEVYNFFHFSSINHFLSVGPGPVKEALNGIGFHMNMPSSQKIIDYT